MSHSNEPERRTIKLKRFAKNSQADILTESEKLPKISKILEKTTSSLPVKSKVSEKTSTRPKKIGRSRKTGHLPKTFSKVSKQTSEVNSDGALAYRGELLLILYIKI